MTDVILRTEKKEVGAGEGCTDTADQVEIGAVLTPCEYFHIINGGPSRPRARGCSRLGDARAYGPFSVR